MKRTLLALAVTAFATCAFAAVTNQDGFETGGTPYAAASEKPTIGSPYPFEDFGDKYCEIDDEGQQLDVTGADAVDMVVQFVCHPSTPEGADQGKICIYANADGKLVVAGSAVETTVTTTTISEDTWYRLTIVKDGNLGYKVYLNRQLLANCETAEAPEDFTSVEVSGSGKLDNFVARTTDPFYSGAYAASVGTGADNEKYATYSDALADVLSSGATAAITIAGETPRTVNGTAANPYEITNLADLNALQAAVAAGKGADKCYVQTADIALTEAWPGIGVQNGKDICTTAAFDTGAFTGTYDGGNHTISGFQMVGVAGNPAKNGEGLDYCGFFNSTFGATIKNLKIAYAGSLFATDTTASTKESGATFVGVAKNSTLQNLTSLEGTVSCSKGFGGIVGYLMAGSTVDSCTNNVNMTSLANNKCGGIAMITQGGSGTATIRNCQNNGTTAGDASQRGGIVGYVAVATTIADCEVTAGSDPSFLHHQSGTLTMTGVNKAPAGVKSYTKTTTDIDGLNLATVDNGVATFVKSADLVLGNTYKVMGPGAAYAFAQAGTISFDQAIATATVTAADGLVLAYETVGTVTTYTTAAAVAKIGDTKYTSLAAAVDGAAEGSTIILLADVALTATQTISKSVTLDLNGKNVTATDCRAFHVTAGTVAFTGTGTISTVVTQNTALADSSSVIRVGSNTAVTSFTLGENVTVTTDYCYGITYFGTMKQTVVINGTVTVTGVQAAISGNGLATYNKAAGGSDVTVNGTVSATQDYAIYNPQTGTTVINGTVTGPGGIEVKAGTVTVGANAQITATGTPSYTQSNQNGTSTVGYAIAAVGNKSYQQPATVSVASGATVTGTVIILKENGSETYGEITSAANTLTIPEGYVWNGPADGVYTLAVASGFDGGEAGKSFTIDTAVQAALEAALPEGASLADPVAGSTSGLTYAQAYALGLFDADKPAADVTPTIELKDGNVVVSIDADAKSGYKVMLSVYESATPIAASAETGWTLMKTYQLGAAEEAAAFEPGSDVKGFYKVAITIENAAE